MNVLGKVVIPKTKATCAYIISALEELARDEFYRRKMILEVKERQKQKKNVEEKGTSCEHLTLKSNDDMNKDSFLTSLKDNISEILEIINKIDGKIIEKTDINEILSIGEELQSKLNSSLKSDTPLTISSYNRYTGTKNSSESLANKSVQASKKEIRLQESLEKNMPLENYLKPNASNDFLETNSNMDFEIVVKEITKIITIKNKDGTIKEEKKIVKIRKEVIHKGAQNSMSLCMSNISGSSKYDTNCDTSECCISELSSQSSHSRKTTVQMMSVNNCINKKFLTKSLLDQRYRPKEIYGETSKSNARMNYDNLLFKKEIFPKFDAEYLGYSDYLSNFICEDDESAGTYIQDSCIPHFKCRIESTEKCDLDGEIPYISEAEQKIDFLKIENRSQCQQQSNDTIHAD